MLINEAARISGFSRDTLRYYEKIGLIRFENKHRRPGNYRSYGPVELERLRQIRALKDFGFTLREIALLFEMAGSAPVNCGAVSDLVDRKVLMIDAKVAELIATRSRLAEARGKCAGNCGEFIGA